MGDLADLEDLASEISGKDLGLGLDVELQYISPQLGHMNRLSPLDGHLMSPWSSRNSFEMDRQHRVSRLSPSPNTNSRTPFLRVRSGGSTGSPDLISASFLKSDTDPFVPLNGKKTYGTENQRISEPSKDTRNVMQPPLPRVKSGPDGVVPKPTPKETESPIAMKRTPRKPQQQIISTPQLPQTRQRTHIPPSPTLPQPVKRAPNPTPFYGVDNIDSLSNARLQAALCSLQTAALSGQQQQQLQPTPKVNPQALWPGAYMHNLELSQNMADPNLCSSREALQKLVLIERYTTDRLPELASPVPHASPFGRTRDHEPHQPLAIAENPGEKKLDRLRRRREIHSAVERRRRDITNNVLNQLAVLVTSKTMPECKMSKSEILQNSVKHILQAHQILGEFATEIARLDPNNRVLSQYESFLEGLVTEEEVAKTAAVKTR